MKKAQPGTVSHGTMREAHLIPRFVAELRSLDHEWDDYLEEIEAGMEAGEDYYSSEAASDALEALFDMLEEHAPAGHYFGSHPGDGSDYGFWPVEEDEFA